MACLRGHLSRIGARTLSIGLLALWITGCGALASLGPQPEARAGDPDAGGASKGQAQTPTSGGADANDPVIGRGDLREILDTGAAHFHNGQYADALLYFDAAVRLLPGEPLPWLARAHAQLGLGDLSGAAESVAMAVALFPGWYEAPIDLPRTFGDERFAAIVADLEGRVAAEPDDAGLRFLLGYCYQFSGRREDAARAFAVVVQLAPDHPVARLFEETI